MMVTAGFSNNESLGEALIARAHRASIVRLTVDIAGGLIAFAAVYLWHPQSWGIPASAALCFAMYGAWAVADRQLQSLDGKPKAFVASLLIIRTIAVAVGVTAALVLLFGTVGLSMGVWTH